MPACVCVERDHYGNRNFATFSEISFPFEVTAEVMMYGLIFRGLHGAGRRIAAGSIGGAERDSDSVEGSSSGNRTEEPSIDRGKRRGRGPIQLGDESGSSRGKCWFLGGTGECSSMGG